MNLFWIFIGAAIATPPACFLSCINEVSKTCPYRQSDFACLCAQEESVAGCLVDICPMGNFLSARDHFLGTCMEHGKPTKTNPHPPKSKILDNSANAEKHENPRSSSRESIADTERNSSLRQENKDQYHAQAASSFKYGAGPQKLGSVRLNKLVAESREKMKQLAEIFYELPAWDAPGAQSTPRYPPPRRFGRDLNP